MGLLMPHRFNIAVACLAMLIRRRLIVSSLSLRVNLYRINWRQEAVALLATEECRLTPPFRCAIIIDGD